MSGPTDQDAAFCAALVRDHDFPRYAATLFVPADKGVVEDLIVAAANDARTKVEETVEEQMRSLTGGMALPPGFKL